MVSQTRCGVARSLQCSHCGGPGALYRAIALFCARIALQSVRPEPHRLHTLILGGYLAGKMTELRIQSLKR